MLHKLGFFESNKITSLNLSDQLYVIYSKKGKIRAIKKIQNRFVGSRNCLWVDFF